MTTTNIGPTELQILLEDDDLCVIDVRSSAEFASEHIPGSLSVPGETIGAVAPEMATTEKPLVLVCRSGARASAACTKLAAAGREHTYLLDGGIDNWEASGGTLNRGDSPVWAIDRQVRLLAGSISLVGVVASVFVPPMKWLAAAISAGLTFSAVTNSCAMANGLARLPYNRSENTDVDKLLASIKETNQ